MDYKKRLLNYIKNHAEFYIISLKYSVEIHISLIKDGEIVYIYENFNEKKYYFDLKDNIFWNSINNLRLNKILNVDFLENIKRENKDKKLKDLYENFEISKFEEMCLFFDGYENLLNEIDKSKLNRENLEEVYFFKLKDIDWLQYISSFEIIENILKDSEKNSLEFTKIKDKMFILNDIELLKRLINKKINNHRDLIIELEKENNLELLIYFAKNKMNTSFYVKDLDLSIKLFNEYNFLKIRPEKKLDLFTTHIFRMIDTHEEALIKEITKTENNNILIGYILALEILCECKYLDKEIIRILKDKISDILKEPFVDKKKKMIDLSIKLSEKIDLKKENKFEKFNSYLDVIKNLNNF